MNKRLLLTIALMLLAGINFWGCSWLGFGEPDEQAAEVAEPVVEVAEPEQTAEPSTETTQENTELEPAPASSEQEASVEIIWRVSGDAVQKYHLYYGTDKTNLSNHVEIDVATLEKTDHPDYGPVFRYKLNNAPASGPLFVSLKAENEHGVSDASDVFQVEQDGGKE